MDIKSVKRKHEPLNEPFGSWLYDDTSGQLLSQDLFAKNGAISDSVVCPKIFVTEEKMADALKDLKISGKQQNINDTSSSNVKSGSSDFLIQESYTNHNNKSRALEKTNDLLDDDASDTCIVFTDELKRQLVNEEVFDIKNFLLASQKSKENQLQIIPWTPPPYCYITKNNVPKNENILETNVYKVEEPQSKKPQNKLKRKHSQLRKIFIEEVDIDDEELTENAANSSAPYYVETQEDETNLTPKDKANNESMDF